MLLERPHDVGVVIIEGEAKVPDPIVEQAAVAIVAAENVPGEEHLLLDQVGALGIRPVQERRVQKPQRAVAQADLVAGAYGGVVERPVGCPSA